MIDGLEGQVEGLAAGTAKVQQPPLDQPPAVVGRRRPVRCGVRAGEGVQLMLPMADGLGVGVIDLDDIEQGCGARPSQPAVDGMAEAAE